MINTGGFLIMASHWKRNDWYLTDYRGRQNFRKHISEIEPQITALLVEKKIMEVKRCSDTGLGTIPRTYIVS